MATTYLRMLRLFSRNIRLFLVCSALVGLTWDGVRTVIFNLYLLRLDYGPEFIGLINGVGALAFALLSLPAGAMGTRWGSRNMVITGAALLTAGFLLLPLAEFFGTWSMTWLMLTTILTFLGFSLYLVNGLPFMMGSTGREERDYVFSVHIALSPLAAFVGSLMAGALPIVIANMLGVSLQQPAPYRTMLWLAGLLLMPGVVALLFTKPVNGWQAPASASSTPDTNAHRAPIGLFFIIALVMALRFGGRGPIATFFNVYLDAELGASTVLIGVLLAASQLLSVPVALAVPLLTERWGKFRTIVWGMMGVALFTLPLALVSQWAVAGLGFIGSSVFFMVSTAPIRVFSQELVTPRWQATMASVLMLGAGVAFAIVSPVGGDAIVALGYQIVFLVAAGLVAASALLFGLYFRRPRGELAHEPPSELAD